MSGNLNGGDNGGGKSTFTSSSLNNNLFLQEKGIMLNGLPISQSYITDLGNKVQRLQEETFRASLLPNSSLTSLKSVCFNTNINSSTGTLSSSSNGSNHVDYNKLALQWQEINQNVAVTKHSLKELLENVKNAQLLLDRWLHIYSSSMNAPPSTSNVPLENNATYNYKQ